MEENVNLTASDEAMVNGATNAFVEQEHANKIAQAAYARGVKAAESKLEKKIEELEKLVQNSKQSEPFDREQFLKEAEERALERAKREEEERKSNEEGARLAQIYKEKLEKGSKSYEDFQEKLKGFNPNEHPFFAMAIANMDDGEEVLYHLQDRGLKISQINEELKKNRNSKYAWDELKKASASIKKNKEISSGLKPTSAPMSKLNPSVTGFSQDGAASVQMLKDRGFYRF